MFHLNKRDEARHYKDIPQQRLTTFCHHFVPNLSEYMCAKIIKIDLCLAKLLQK